MKPKTKLFQMAAAAAIFVSFSQSEAQVVTAFAGNSATFGYGGDGGPATATGCKMHSPQEITHDMSGNIYFIDKENYVVRKVSTAGIITTVAGNGSPLLSGTNPTGVAATSLQLGALKGIAVDASGNFYFTEDGYIRKVSTSGIYTTYAGNGAGGYSGDGGPATAAGMIEGALAFDASGNLYLTQYFYNVVRKISTGGTITTVVGNGTGGYSGDGGPATAAMLHGPRDLEFDGTGNLYIVDASNNRVRKVSTSGIISTFAGNGSSGFAGDGGAATAAKLNDPESITVDAGGDVFIGDGLNQRIRRVLSSTGMMITYVGTGSWIWNGNGLPGPATNIWAAQGVDVFSGSLYFTESSNDDIRTISTHATLMNPGLGSTGDGLTLLPNPNSGSFVLSGNTPIADGRVQLCIRDVTGRTIYREDIETANGNLQAQLNIPGGSPTGVYFLSVSSPSVNTTLRFVKE